MVFWGVVIIRLLFCFANCEAFVNSLSSQFTMHFTMQFSACFLFGWYTKIGDVSNMAYRSILSSEGRRNPASLLALAYFSI